MGPGALTSPPPTPLHLCLSLTNSLPLSLSLSLSLSLCVAVGGARATRARTIIAHECRSRNGGICEVAPPLPSPKLSGTMQRQSGSLHNNLVWRPIADNQVILRGEGAGSGQWERQTRVRCRRRQ
jgi:hypothetical protein